MNCVRTVLGDVDAEEMGFTYTHEHVCCNPYTAEKDPTLAITDIEGSIRELRLFAEAGGSAIVEGTAADYGRDPQKLVYASRQSGVHLIATTGLYLFDHNPDFIDDISTEELAELFIREIEEGMDGTEIRAGQLKCAVSPRFIHPREEKCLRAAARAQQKSNAPIWIHHGGMMGIEILRLLDRCQADLSRVVLGHMDRNPDPYEYKKIASMGSFLSVDNIARVYRYPVQTNIDMILDLMEEGYLERLLISADFGRSNYFRANGGGPGLEYILNKFIPRLKESGGITENEIRTIFVENPKKVYGCF